MLKLCVAIAVSLVQYEQLKAMCDKFQRLGCKESSAVEKFKQEKKRQIKINKW